MKLPPLSVGNVLAALGLAGSLLGFAISVGKVMAKQEAMALEQERQGRLIEKVLDHVAFRDTGHSGPEQPLEK